jgi:hypothetical protein
VILLLNFAAFYRWHCCLICAALIATFYAFVAASGCRAHLQYKNWCLRAFRHSTNPHRKHIVVDWPPFSHHLPPRQTLRALQVKLAVLWMRAMLEGMMRGLDIPRLPPDPPSMRKGMRRSLPNDPRQCERERWWREWCGVWTFLASPRTLQACAKRSVGSCQNDLLNDHYFGHPRSDRVRDRAGGCGCGNLLYNHCFSCPQSGDWVRDCLAGGWNRVWYSRRQQ